MEGSVSERLASLVARRVDGETRARARLHVVDWISCAVLGATSPAGRALLDYGRERKGSAGPCGTIGVGTRAAEIAAFVNGGLGNIYEMDDLHRTSIVHPGDVVIPAALAAAERAGSSGQTLLDAIVRGYEAAIRIGAAAGTAHYQHWYNTATCGVFGSAVAVSSILGLDGAGTVDAVGQAGMQAAGLWQCRMEPTFSKQLATARAAQSGLIAADLAANGFPGPKAIFEGEHGFFAATCPESVPEAIVATPDGPWLIHDVSFKPWPACRHTHPVIEACCALRRRSAAGAPREIGEISVWTYREAVDFCDNPNPATPHEARFSIQHCAAVALLRGEPGLDDFLPEAIADDDIAALRSKVSLRHDAKMTEAFPRRYSAGVGIVSTGGSADEAEVAAARGDPENPMNEDDILAKSRDLLSAAGVPDAVADRIRRAALDLPAAKSPAALSALLAGLRPKPSRY